MLSSQPFLSALDSLSNIHLLLRLNDEDGYELYNNIDSSGGVIISHQSKMSRTIMIQRLFTSSPVHLIRRY
jgi:hypothetical protein